MTSQPGTRPLGARAWHLPLVALTLTFGACADTDPAPIPTVTEAELIGPPSVHDQCKAVVTCIGSLCITLGNRPNGTSCDDGSPCTSNDICTAGSCGGSARSCDDGNGCTDDTCDPSSGCLATANTAACDDANACTTGDVCAAGACGGASVTCDDGNVCTDDACIPASGCVATANAAPCDDGNVCTTGDACAAGTCGGALVTCDDDNGCTDDACDPSSGCVATANTATCDDGDACTSGDVCAAGSCGGASITCDDGNGCTDDTCDPALGCVATSNSAACDDGSACTTGDTCAAGSCGGSTIACDDGNPCTDDRCDPSVGCVFEANTAACDDGNECTVGDICGGGVCGGEEAACCHLPAAAAVEQAQPYRTQGGGGLYVTFTQTPSQSFTVGRAGRLVGVETGIAMCLAIPGQWAELVLYGPDGIIAVVDKDLDHIDDRNCFSDRQFVDEPTCAGWFDLRALEVDVAVGEVYAFVLRLGGARGVCDLDTEVCTGGNIGRFCYGDDDCDSRMIIGGIDFADTYPGGGSNYGGDLMFRTFVE